MQTGTRLKENNIRSESRLRLKEKTFVVKAAKPMEAYATRRAIQHSTLENVKCFG